MTTRIENKKTFKIITKVVNEMVNLIKPSYGPSNNKVIIDKLTHRLVVDDGVQIARDFELNDPLENAIARVIKETAIATNDRAGDGTTSSMIMLQAIIKEVGRKLSFNGRKIELELKKGLEEVKKHLDQNSMTISSKEELKKVALVSFDDENIATLISELYFELGKEGIITIDRSSTMETVVEKTEGISLKSGYISPYMVTNPERMETVFENPYILITNYRLTESSDLLPVLEKMASEGKQNLIVIAENVEQKALAVMISNLPQMINPVTKKAGVLSSICIATPKNVDSTYLDDLALMTGATMFSVDKGTNLRDIELSDLGRASKIVVRQGETIIVDPKGEGIYEAIESLKVAIDEEKNTRAKDKLSKRLALLTNKLAVIKIGATTENELKALKYKVEDALSAVKSAFNNGVVCGSGLALANIKTSSPILNKALKYPALQLRKNVGLRNHFFDQKFRNGEALNVVTGEVGLFLDVGVIDPVEVLKAGVESAVSIASLLITSTGMVVDVPKQ